MCEITGHENALLESGWSPQRPEFERIERQEHYGSRNDRRHLSTD